MKGVNIEKEYYKVLGVGIGATQGEITKRFRREALRCHPDRNPGKEEHYKPQFQALVEAYEVLSDEGKRRYYDSARDAGKSKREQRPFGQRESRNANTSNHFGEAPRNWSRDGPKRPTYGRSPKPTPNFRQQNTKHGHTKKQGFNTGTGDRDEPMAPGNSAHNKKRRSNDNVKEPEKQGFNPGTADGDEPMAPSNSAYNKKRRSNDNVKESEKQGFNPGTADGDEPMAPSNSAYNKKRRSNDNVKESEKQGFNPGTADGDEPMAPSNSAYNKKRRSDPLSKVRDEVSDEHHPSVDDQTLPKTSSRYRKPYVEDEPDSSEAWLNMKKSIQNALSNLPQPPSMEIKDDENFTIGIANWGEFESKMLHMVFVKQQEMEHRKFDELSIKVWEEVQRYWEAARKRWWYPIFVSEDSDEEL